jgi:prepilin-type N-terminal cleavage/methylation domain-containing protein
MKKAFTLAEVLITLGIIGIVAALTMPSLIANYQKQQTVTQLQKAYSVLNQAKKLSAAQGNVCSETPATASEFIEKYWAPYMKIIKTCNTYQACGFKSPMYVNPQGENTARTLW